MPGHEDNEAAAVEWLRSYETNPAGKSAQVVVRQDSRIVATGNATPRAFICAGREMIVAEFGGMYTAPSSRGQGFFQTVVRQLEEEMRAQGVVAGYATANRQSGPGFVSHLGWEIVEPWIRWIRPLVPGVRHLFDQVARYRGHRLRGLVVETGAPTLQDDSLDEARRRLNHFLRSPRQFAWRFPSSRYVMTRCYDQNHLVGWAVGGRTVRLGRSAIAIADLAVAPGARGVEAAMMGALARALPGAQLIFGGTLAGGHAENWRSATAIGRPARMPLIARSLDGSTAVPIFRGMAFDIGDSDTV